MTAPPTLSIGEQFPVRDIRFVNGRTHHRARRPVDQRWYEDPLEAACGKTGWLATGYSLGTIRECPGCARAVEAEAASPAA
ncbi:hypothetical protein [Streptomyces sp. NBC_00568]|uniref:hypothetical protein n=1 Tax=Streptomyces sp. NBC_00568 TaxID=2975779 RepID=UPI00224D3B36|nr:hypothetical protein [Streptomyces sp. NBC_00568]MCX4993431.1 hypothetical protein [Streptomyces sp. NBC_00568]